MTRPKYRFDVPLFRNLDVEDLGPSHFGREFSIQPNSAEDAAVVHDWPHDVVANNRHQAMQRYRQEYVDDMEYELSVEEDEEYW